jgi:hypothetical protein
VRELARRGDQYLQQRSLVLPSGRRVRAGHGVAGAVDQRVDFAAVGLERREDLRRRLDNGEIGGDHQAFDAVAQPRLVGERVQAVDPAGAQRQVVAVAGVDPGQRRADARRGARDQGQPRAHRFILATICGAIKR